MPPAPSPGPGAHPGSTSRGSARDAALARVRFRRALTLLLMTLVLPGSAQLVAGSRTVGRLAMRVWVSLLGGLLLVVLLGLVWHGFVFWFASNTVVLGFLRLLLCAARHRLGAPVHRRLAARPAARADAEAAARDGRPQRRAVFSVAGSLLFASHVVAVQRGFIATMFGDGTATSAHDGRYNVLLLGGDSGADRWGLRPDSITVASIDADTGKTILFGLPRNMTNFPFAEGSVMAEQFPEGYDCEGCELNSLATWAGDNKALFAGVGEPRRRGDRRGRRGHHRAEDQLLRDGQPAGLPQPWSRPSAGSPSTSATGSRSAASAGR